MALACLIGPLAFVVALVAVYALSTRRRDRRVQRSTRELVISPMSGLVLGAMFVGFQAILQPESRHRIVQEQREESLDDQSGHEPLGGWLLVQQLQQIRKGIEVEELVVQRSAARSRQLRETRCHPE
jgi:hypothetical protein